MIKLNLGCGGRCIKDWVNVDYSIGAKVSRIPIVSVIAKKIGLFQTKWSEDVYIHDLRKTFPWGDAVVDYIYSSHTLEHLTREEGKLFISECYRVLKPGGILRIVIPDLAIIVDRYVQGDLPADHFVEQLGVLYKEPNRTIAKLLIPYISFPHKCMYDELSLLSAFTNAGLVPSSAKPFISAIPDVEDIEIAERTVDAIIVEGVKAHADAASIV